MDVKARIHEKADQLFKRYGIKSITMDEIAVQLGISKKTIYQYFADKEELVSAVMEAHVTESQNECLIDIEQAANAIHEEFLIQDRAQEHLRDLNPVAIHDMQKFHPGAYDKFMRYKNSFMRQMVENNIRKGLAEGLYRPEIRPDILSKFRVDSIFLSFSPEFNIDASVGLADLQQELFVHYLMGIGSPKGHELIRQYLWDRQKLKATPMHPSPLGKTGA